MKQPLISIILPTLNAARTLGLCLDSIRAQDYPADSVEIVMADAGSTDDTLEIAQSHGVDMVVPNPLKTGEAGKSAAIAASHGDIIALVDSDNILEGPAVFSKVADAFADDSVWHAEPMYYTAHKEDSLVNRYCALIGMNDPFSYFIGNYNRWSYLSKRFTAYPYETVREDENAVVIDVHPGKVPTFGANGFFTRRAALEGVDWEPYYFDIDVFQQMAGAGRRRIAVLKTGTRHLFCDRIGTFRRKQARRIRDFHYHNRAGSRTYYENGPVSRWRYLWFLLSCVTIIPLLFQTIRGMASKPSSAWFFHTPACLITFWEYSWGTVRSLFKAEEYSRDGWSQ